jgi:hypothetical protein
LSDCSEITFFERVMFMYMKEVMMMSSRYRSKAKRKLMKYQWFLYTLIKIESLLLTDTVVNPMTMMIKIYYTSIAQIAMHSIFRAVDFTFRAQR